MVDLTLLLARIISGAPVDSRDVAALDVDTLLGAAAEHDVVPLLADRLLRTPDLPPVLAGRLREQATAAAVVDLVREAEVRRFFDRMDTAGVGALLVKGSHLAYTHYERPDLRARVDTDVLVARTAVPVVHRLLTDVLGYEASDHVSNDLTAPQRAYTTRLPRAAHTFDVHWQLSSPRVFASMPSVEDLTGRSLPLAKLGPAARVPSSVDALLIACVHRVAHHLDACELKWLYDIHLVAGRFDREEWDRFVKLAAASAVGAVCHRSLTLAAECFGTPLPDDVRSGADLTAGAGNEPSAAYLKPEPMLRRVIGDARVLSWTDRVRLMREHLFPATAYMRQVYAPSSRLPLPVLYARRIVRGMWGWFRLRT